MAWGAFVTQTLLFNRVFPGLLIAAALVGTIALGISAVSYHIGTGGLWTATFPNATAAPRETDRGN